MKKLREEQVFASKPSKKQPYVKPEFTELGRVADLTQGRGSFTFADTMNTMTMMNP